MAYILEIRVYVTWLFTIIVKSWLSWLKKASVAQMGETAAWVFHKWKLCGRLAKESNSLKKKSSVGGRVVGVVRQN